MENEEREVRGMAVVWKRLRALAVFLLVLSMLESDGIEQEIMRISIGSVSYTHLPLRSVLTEVHWTSSTLSRTDN